MGLDAVEIVMDVEDRFGITIQNAEAERVRTVGELVALIHDRIVAAHKTHAAAYRSTRRVPCDASHRAVTT